MYKTTSMLKFIRLFIQKKITYRKKKFEVHQQQMCMMFLLNILQKLIYFYDYADKNTNIFNYKQERKYVLNKKNNRRKKFMYKRIRVISSKLINGILLAR